MTRKIIYSMQMSLDGFIEDTAGGIGFTVPDPEVHEHLNRLEETIDTHIYGRRLYETMNGFWPTAADDPSAPPEILDYARIWNGLDKLVFSRTLERVDGRARLATEGIEAEAARLKAAPGKHISVGGATLAAQFIARGLVDEFWVIVCPVLIGGGKPMFGSLPHPTRLTLRETRSFSAGTLVLTYEQKGA